MAGIPSTVSSPFQPWAASLCVPGKRARTVLSISSIPTAYATTLKAQIKRLWGVKRPSLCWDGKCESNMQSGGLLRQSIGSLRINADCKGKGSLNCDWARVSCICLTHVDHVHLLDHSNKRDGVWRGPSVSLTRRCELPKYAG